MRNIFIPLDPTNTTNVASPGLVKGFARANEIFVLEEVALFPILFSIADPFAFTLLLLEDNPASYPDLDPANTEVIPVIRTHGVIAHMGLVGDTTFGLLAPPLKVDFVVVNDYIGLYGWIDTSFGGSTQFVLRLTGNYRPFTQAERTRMAHEKNDVNYGEFPSGAPSVNWTVQLSL